MYSTIAKTREKRINRKLKTIKKFISLTYATKSLC